MIDNSIIIIQLSRIQIKVNVAVRSLTLYYYKVKRKLGSTTENNLEYFNYEANWMKPYKLIRDMYYRTIISDRVITNNHK